MNKPAMIPRLLFLIGTIHRFLFASAHSMIVPTEVQPPCCAAVTSTDRNSSRVERLGFSPDARARAVLRPERILSV